MILERTELWCERRSGRGGKKTGSTFVVSLTRDKKEEKKKRKEQYDVEERKKEAPVLCR